MGLRPLLFIALLGCGRAELQGPPGNEEVEATSPAPAMPECVIEEETSAWQCETVSALQVVSVRVTWTAGQPEVRALLRNTTGQFLNYPGVQVSASSPALQPSHPREALYGLMGCNEAELGMGFTGSVPSGSPVTFTAIPVHINGDECPLSFPAVSVTVTAP